jgi:flagellar hook-associated protein 2
MTTTTAPTSTVNVTGSASYLTGTASGLDTAALIKAAVAQKTVPADTLDAKVTASKTKITAYQTMQSLVSALSTSISALSSSTFSSVANSGGAFQAKAVTIASTDGAAAGAYLAASADSTAAATSYAVSVQQLASAEKVASSAMSKTTALGLTGAFTLGEGTSAAQSIALTPDMTLADVASAINAVATASGVSASLIQTAPGSYKLVLSANDTDQPIAAASGDGVLTGLGLTDAGGAFNNILQAAKPALATIDGTPVSAPTNDLTDAVSGLSLSLLNTTPAGVAVNMTVQPDFSAVKTAITNFVSAYNALRDFVATNQATGADGTAASTAVLFADPLLRSATQMLGSIVAGDSTSATGPIKNLADLGITLGADNKLSVSNETTLDNALLGGLPQVASLFQSSFTPSDSALKLLQNTSTQAFHFTLDVTADADGTLTGASVGGDSSLFTVSGARIVGTKGGPYDGLSFALVANGDRSISIDIAPGFANLVTAFASQYGDGTTGLIQQQINALSSQDDSWTTRSDQIRSDAATYQASLVTRYASMEQEVSAAQLVQAQIKAILNGNNNG